MKALVLKEYNKFEYLDVPDPVVGDGEVLLRIKAAGTCGSDVHGMDGSSGRRIPPIIMGHEASGIIEEVGDNVTGWKRGDRVTFDSTIYCGECFYCRQGKINLCENRRVLGVSTSEYKQQGAFAEYLVVPARILFSIPDGVSFEHAAMVEPCAIAFHAVERAPISLNDTAVVVGAGMVGLLVIQALRLAGCGKIAAVDIKYEKLALAEKVGADVCLNPKDNEVDSEVRKLTDGRGADIGFEVAGNTAALQTALASTRKGGALILVGNLSPKVDLPLQSIVTREITLYGSCASQGEYPACLDMIDRGLIDVEPLISKISPLSDGGEWFHRLYEGNNGLLKIILRP